MAEKKTDSEKTVAFKKEFKELLDNGIKASKRGLKKAGKAITDFGDTSVIKIDITKFKVKLEKKYVELGKLCASVLLEKKAASVTKKTEGVEEIIAEIEKLNKKISDEEKKLKGKAGSKATAKPAAKTKTAAKPEAKTAAKAAVKTEAKPAAKTADKTKKAAPAKTAKADKTEKTVKAKPAAAKKAPAKTTKK